MLPYKKPRPSFEERKDRVTLGLEEINRFIVLLEGSYERTGEEPVRLVLEELKQIKARTWADEEHWREQEDHESHLYFDQLPFSVRVFLTSDELR
jgi:hypothetical protein